MRLRKLGIVLLSLLLTAMAMVPLVSAEEILSTEEHGSQFFSNISMSNLSSKIVGYVSPDMNVNMSKEEFLKINAPHIKFLRKSLSQSDVDQMMETAYNKAINNDVKSASTGSSKSINSIVQIGGYDIVLWPYSNTAQNTNAYSGSVNLFFFGMTKSQVVNYMENSAAILYSDADGTQEFGIRGPSVGSMSWTSVPMHYQLQDGSYFGTRYHLIVFEGDYSSSLQENWCYGQTHKEYWSWINPGPDHFLYGNAFDLARTHFNQAMNGAKPMSSMYLYSEYPGYADGYAYTYWMD
jgi:hypothetical protein